MPRNKQIYNTLWRTKCCEQGSKCWCRRICTITGKEVYQPAMLDREIAIYLVKLHNNHVRNNLLK